MERITASTASTTDLLLGALAEDANEVQCVVCRVTELVISLDGPLDEPFLSHYHCADCDHLE